ncbi:MAG: hypothetical protein IPL39_25175 [Opitutaceae bacterium]|nr:hypothetical protein [Opitutaceae bacterium]
MDRASRANAQTVAQAEGSTEWLPLSQRPGFAASFAARSLPPPIPGAAAPDLPAPRPGLSLPRPQPPSAPADPAAAAHACADRPLPSERARYTDTRLGDRHSANFWLTAEASFVAMLANAVASSPTAGGPGGLRRPFPGVHAGVYRLLCGCRADEPAGFGDVFAGFTPAGSTSSCCSRC